MNRLLITGTFILLVALLVSAHLSATTYGTEFKPSVADIPVDAPLSQRQVQILRATLNTGGSISVSEHDEFWAEFTRWTPAQRQQFAVRVQASASLFPEYQRALWLAARQSLSAHRPIHTERLRIVEMKLATIESSSVTRLSASTAREFLRAAAYGIPLHKQGRNITITPELIDSVLTGLDETFLRLNHLLDPLWGKDSPHE